MNNLSSSFKKFLGNKNTVTILGVLLIVGILAIGYHYRINQKTSLREVPVAKETILPKTEITDSMIEMKSIPTEFLVGNYYDSAQTILNNNLYTSYNATIPQGSLFYTELLVKKEDVPDLIFNDLEEGYRPYMLSVENNSGLYGGPGDYIDIYFSGINEDDKVMFGQFLSGIEILSVVDENGNNAYGTQSEEMEAPAYLYLAVPEELYLLLGRYDRLNEIVEGLNAHLVITPHLVDPSVDKVDIYLNSEDIKKLINDNSEATDTKNDKIEVKKKK